MEKLFREFHEQEGRVAKERKETAGELASVELRDNLFLEGLFGSSHFFVIILKNLRETVGTDCSLNQRDPKCFRRK